MMDAGGRGNVATILHQLQAVFHGLGDVFRGKVQHGALQGPGLNVVTKPLITPAVCQCSAIPCAGGARGAQKNWFGALS